MGRSVDYLNRATQVSYADVSTPEVMEREFAITFAPEDFEEILGCSTEEAERLFDEVLIEEGLGDILQAEAFAMFVRMVRDRMADRSKQAP